MKSLRDKIAIELRLLRKRPTRKLENDVEIDLRRGEVIAKKNGIKI